MKGAALNVAGFYVQRKKTMSDNVIDLDQKKNERITANHQALHDAHEHGIMFKFEKFEYDDMAVGLISGDDPVSLLTNVEALTGIAMTIEDAIALGTALIEAGAAARTTLQLQGPKGREEPEEG